MRGEHGSPQRQVRPQEFNKPRSEGRLRRGCNGCLVEDYMAHKSGCHSSSQKIPKLAGKSPEIDAFLRRAIYCWMFFGARFCFLGVPGSLLSLLLCFSCFSAFPASLLLCCLFSLLLCFFCISAFPALKAFLLLCFCAFLLLLFYFFFSSVMSCVFAALLPASLFPVFTVSLFSIFFGFLSPVCILNKTLERP